jgi:hypothetical protein
MKFTKLTWLLALGFAALVVPVMHASPSVSVLQSARQDGGAPPHHIVARQDGGAPPHHLTAQDGGAPPHHVTARQDGGAPPHHILAV